MIWGHPMLNHVHGLVQTWSIEAMLGHGHGKAPSMTRRKVLSLLSAAFLNLA